MDRPKVLTGNAPSVVMDYFGGYILPHISEEIPHVHQWFIGLKNNDPCIVWRSIWDGEAFSGHVAFDHWGNLQATVEMIAHEATRLLVFSHKRPEGAELVRGWDTK